VKLARSGVKKWRQMRMEFAGDGDAERERECNMPIRKYGV
jgi:hypothetical protein